MTPAPPTAGAVTGCWTDTTGNCGDGINCCCGTGCCDVEIGVRSCCICCCVICCCACSGCGGSGTAGRTGCVDTGTGAPYKNKVISLCGKAIL